MEQQPSTRMQRQGPRPAGPEAQITCGTLHIRYHQQEETLKASFRFGLMALVIALAAAFGVTQSGGVAQAQVPAGTTKTCTLADTTATCTVSIPSLLPGTSTITLTGPAGA